MNSADYLRRELIRLLMDHCEATKQKPYITFVTMIGDQVMNTSAIPYQGHFRTIDNAAIPTSVLTLDIGRQACSVNFGEKELTVYTTLNKRPITVVVPYGSLLVARVHGDPLAALEFIPFFPQPEKTQEPQPVAETKPPVRGAHLRVVK